MRSFKLTPTSLVGLDRPHQDPVLVSGIKLQEIGLEFTNSQFFPDFRTDPGLSHPSSTYTTPVLDSRNNKTSDEATRSWGFFLALRSTWLQQWPTKHARSRRRLATQAQGEVWTIHSQRVEW